MYPTAAGPLTLTHRPNSSFLVDNLLARGAEAPAVASSPPVLVAGGGSPSSPREHLLQPLLGGPGAQLPHQLDCCSSSGGMTPRDDEDEMRTPPPPLKFGVTAILADHGGAATVHARDKERIFGGAARSAAAASLLAAATGA